MYQVQAGHADLRHGRVSKRSIGTSLKFLGVTLAALAVAGCASMKTPERLYSLEQESNALRGGIEEWAADFKNLSKGERRKARNEVIAARKYAIDMQYTQYEAELTREIQTADFAAAATTQALSTAALLTPVNHTKDMLTGLGTGVGGIGIAYSDKMLRGKLIESVQSSMRSARHERAVVIYANMRCSIKTYPMAMAMSDLEAYYRAGTFTTGLIKLTQTIAKEESKTAASADAHKPGDTDGQAALNGIAAEAAAKANGAALQKRAGKHRCEVEDRGD